MEEYKYKDITGNVIGAAMQVHKFLGNGFQEVISVELKAIIKREDVHLAQAINYLEAYNIEIGLLINFGSKNLEVKRLINTKYKAGTVI